MKYYDSILCNFTSLLYGGANTKAECKREVGYFYTTYELDQGPTQSPENFQARLVLLAGPEVSKEANCQSAPPCFF